MKKNNWYIITGGPCAGKSTTISLLKEKGYTTTDETARVYFQQELAKGKTNEQIRQDPKHLQESILAMQMDLEKSLNPKELIFLDRAIPDSYGYFLYHNLKLPPVLTSLTPEDYQKVFFLELVPSQHDEVRNESEEDMKKISSFLYNGYKTLGFEVISVPFMEKNQRVEYILSRTLMHNTTG